MEKTIDKLTAFTFLLIAIASLALAIKNYDNLAGIVFLLITLLGAIGAYVVNEEANEL